MAFASIAAATLLLALVLEAPGIAGSGNGPLGLLSVAVTVAIALGAMATSAGLAVLSAGRAWVALRVP